MKKLIVAVVIILILLSVYVGANVFAFEANRGNVSTNSNSIETAAKFDSEIKQDSFLGFVCQNRYYDFDDETIVIAPVSRMLSLYLSIRLDGVVGKSNYRFAERIFSDEEILHTMDELNSADLGDYGVVSIVKMDSKNHVMVSVFKFDDEKKNKILEKVTHKDTVMFENSDEMYVRN